MNPKSVPLNPKKSKITRFKLLNLNFAMNHYKKHSDGNCNSAVNIPESKKEKSIIKPIERPTDLPPKFKKIKQKFRRKEILQ